MHTSVINKNNWLRNNSIIDENYQKSEASFTKFDERKIRTEIDKVRNDIKKTEREKNILMSAARKKIATSKVIRDRALNLISKDLQARKDEMVELSDRRPTSHTQTRRKLFASGNNNDRSKSALVREDSNVVVDSLITQLVKGNISRGVPSSCRSVISDKFVVIKSDTNPDHVYLKDKDMVKNKYDSYKHKNKAHFMNYKPAFGNILYNL
jgi:hypothetical protein